MKKFLVIAAFVCLLVAPSATASGKSVTLGVTPSVPVVGDSLVFSGCGYRANKPVYLIIQQPDYNGLQIWIPTDGSGCFSSSTVLTYIAIETGSYDVFAFQAVGGPNYQGHLVFSVG